MDTAITLFLLALAGFVWFFLVKGLVGVVTIFDYQRGLLYQRGVFARVVGPGRYRYFRPRSTVHVVDMRRMLIALPGQEVLTQDQIAVKVTLAGFYEVADPARARHTAENPLAALYALLQIALREEVGRVTLDAFLEGKSDLGAALSARVAEGAAELGLQVSALAVKDVMLPAHLKRAYSGLLEAQKEAQRQLEKARGEQAVLRSLANAATLYARSPMLLQARLLQAVTGANNNIVFQAGESGLTLTTPEAPEKGKSS